MVAQNIATTLKLLKSNRNQRTLARLISQCENQLSFAEQVLALVYPNAGNAHVVGVTGSPGAGKSTLVDHLAQHWARQGKRVAILAVDPSSPFSGGAVLGDRIRMVHSEQYKDIFIRSMATRGALGGTARATLSVVSLLDYAGYDLILVETVGVGQAEVDIVRTADSCLVVLVPGMGDSVQTLKAGILEIADLYVINKADRPGADLLHRDLRLLLSLGAYGSQDWKPPILETQAQLGQGTEMLCDSIVKHQKWLKLSNEARVRRLKILEENILAIAGESIRNDLLQNCSTELHSLAAKCFARQTDPWAAARLLVKRAKA